MLPLVGIHVERAILVLGLVWFINLTNFMDGIDWMTVVEIVPVCAALTLLGITGMVPALGTVLPVVLSLLGAMLGFAPFNRHVAQLFLGDVGSLPIGALVGWLLILLASSGHLVAALILPLYYLSDATITLARRALRGENLAEAHRSHFYQIATTRGFTVPQVTARVLVLNVCLAVLAVAAVAASRSRCCRRAAGAGSDRHRDRAGAFERGTDEMSGRVLVTGAAGFIGRDLVVRLAAAGWQVRAAARDIAGVPAAPGSSASSCPIWPARRLGAAGRRHQPRRPPRRHRTRPRADSGGDVPPRQRCRRRQTWRRRLRAAGVRRVLMISSVKAQCGDAAPSPLTEAMTPAPDGPYGRSKLEGERLLAARLATGATDWAVLRPVLVYGRGVKANMAMLARLARSGLPLPLGALTARRSLLGLDQSRRCRRARAHGAAGLAQGHARRRSRPARRAGDDRRDARRAWAQSRAVRGAARTGPARRAARRPRRHVGRASPASSSSIPRRSRRPAGARSETAAEGLARWMRDDPASRDEAA